MSIEKLDDNTFVVIEESRYTVTLTELKAELELIRKNNEYALEQREWVQTLPEDKLQFVGLILPIVDTTELEAKIKQLESM